jgi:hypothetical protein
MDSARTFFVPAPSVTITTSGRHAQFARQRVPTSHVPAQAPVAHSAALVHAAPPVRHAAHLDVSGSQYAPPMQLLGLPAAHAAPTARGCAQEVPSQNEPGSHARSVMHPDCPTPSLGEQTRVVG